MFRIHTSSQSFGTHPHLPARIKGCPSDGLPSVDFRRQHSIPEAPNDKIDITIDITSERICRQFPHMLNSSSDIGVFHGDGLGYRGTAFDGHLVHIAHPIIFSPAVIAGVAKKELTETDVERFLREVDQKLKDAITAAEKAKAEAEAKAIADRQAAEEWLKNPNLDSMIVRHADGEPAYTTNSPHHADLTEDERKHVSTLAKARINAIWAELNAKRATEKQAKLEALSPHFTDTERAMAKRGCLCPKTVRSRLTDETLATVRKALPGGDISRVNDFPVKIECPTPEQFNALLAAEGLLGIQGVIHDSKWTDWTWSICFTVQTPDGRDLKVIYHPDTAKAETEDDSDDE